MNSPIASDGGFIVPDDWHDITEHDSEHHLTATPASNPTTMENPNSSLPAQHHPTPLPHQPKISTYPKQKAKDHAAIKTHLDAAIRKSDAYFGWSAEDRWIFLQNERFVKLRERERDLGNGRGARGSVRQLYPERYDAVAEVSWLWNAYQGHLGGEGNRGLRWSVIMEEDGLGGQVVEKMDSFKKLGEGERGVDQDEDDEEVGMPVKKEWGEDDEEPEVRVKKEWGEDAVEREVDEELGSTWSDAGPRGIPCEGTEPDAYSQEVTTCDSLRRAWLWIEGEMVAWPPSEDAEQAELERELLQGANKRLAVQRLAGRIEIISCDGVKAWFL